LWIGSWYLMYPEITRWRHVKPSLAFNSDPDNSDPDAGIIRESLDGSRGIQRSSDAVTS
jgi:hypothetical protein